MSEKELIDALLTGRPYFGAAMRALQGPPVRHAYLSLLVGTLFELKPQGDIQLLEIGSWAGASTVTWAKTMQRHTRKGKITCVDQWQPYFDDLLEPESHYQEMNEAAKHNKILKLFLHNIHTANVSEMVKYVIGSTSKVLPQLPSEAFDLIYIDGSHLLEFVQADIKEAKRLIRDGGIICGDDLELQLSQVDEREHRHALSLKKDYVASPKTNAFYHPGVTEAVAVEFGEVSSWEGVWATRKQGAQWTRVEVDVRALEIPDHIALAEASHRKDKTEQISLIGATESFNLIKSNGRFLAVSKQLGPVELFSERLGDRELAPWLFCGENLQEVQEKILAVEKDVAVAKVELVDESSRYSIVKAGDRFLAIAKELGPVDLFGERIGERELAPVIFSDRSLEAVRAKVMVFERQTAVPEIDLIEEVGHYNIIRAGDRFLAVAKELGPINLFRERIGERELMPLVLVSADAAHLRQRIAELTGESLRAEQK
jgi:predicted O-methyltransferase YrrM